MNGTALCFLIINAVALLLLPRRLAPMPLIGGACYMTLGQGFELGPLTFTVIRILVAVGVIRVLVRGERIANGLNRLDWLMIVWSGWAALSSIFHESGALINHLGLVYNSFGIYFLLRVFCASLDDVILLCRLTACLLIPVALEMLYENRSGHNLFSILGGVPDLSEIREGRVRASGPFAHSILAGTVGAVNIPTMIGLWRFHRKTAMLGIAAATTIVLCSASSGPVMSTIFGVVALAAWRLRHRMRMVRYGLVASYLLLDAVMKAPAYYLLAHIDIAGGSTGWHRARLIESTFEHSDEWWFAGTDYTRHWMPTGVPWSPNHTDITNYYLNMAVLGGLPLMCLLIAILATTYAYVGERLRADSSMSFREGFMIWTLGAALFAHSATSLSVTYFDQSFLFFYLIPATVGSIRFSKPSGCAERDDGLAPVVSREIRLRDLSREQPLRRGPASRKAAWTEKRSNSTTTSRFRREHELLEGIHQKSR